MHFHVGRTEDASDLIKKFHYSRRDPSNIQVCGTWHEDGGLFGDFGPALAACVFSIPPTRWSEPVFELSRLVRREDVRPSLTGLIAATCDFIRQHKMADLLVSFADATQSHHGGIYQAASWTYGGKRESRMDGLTVNGEFVPGRSANHRWGTRSPIRLVNQIGAHHSIEPHYDEGKHIYWRALNKNGKKRADRIGLLSLPYPKPFSEVREALRGTQ